MSITNNNHADTFANYSWNTMNATIIPSNDTNVTNADPVVPVTNYTFEYQHEFINRCYLLDNLKWFKLIKNYQKAFKTKISLKLKCYQN